MRLWISSLLLVLPQLIVAQSHIFVTAPNIIRVGNDETVLISIFNTDRNNNPVTVTVTLKNGDGSDICPPTQVDVLPDNPQIVPLYIDPENVPVVETQDDLKVFAKLVVSSPTLNNFEEEKDVLISYNEGFVFIQTDKPIYTPDQRVSIRLIVLDQYLRPSTEPVQLEILTPQGVIVHRSTEVRARNGFKTKVFSFPHEPMFGNWTVVAHYGYELKTNRSVQFEVKEYVLPTFSVKLTPPDYILEGQEAIDITIKAMYVYDKPVLGVFYAKVGILGFDGDIDIKVRKTGQMLATGIGHFRIYTIDLGDDWFTENEGKRLYLEVSVLESASGRSENVSDISAKFVLSPYQFTWDRTVRYYKKGLPYKIKIDLIHPNGRPADRVMVNVVAKCILTNQNDRILFGDRQGDEVNEPTRTNNRGQVNFHVYVQNDCESIQVQLQTQDNRLINGDGTNNNADVQITLQPYVSPTGSDFLLLRLNQEIVTAGNPLDVEALLENNGAVPHLAYFVITKGRIIQAGLLNQDIPNFQGFRIQVSFDMVPSARIVAFYINQHGQVVADSLWIDIQRVCENQVSVAVVGRRSHEILVPDALIELQVDASPGTTVGLLAVDKAVYLLRDYHRLTKDKMYQTMDSYDTGCGPGGGRDSADVFKQAGVTVLSSANLDVDRREFYGCPTPHNARRRRSIQDQLAEYEGNDQDHHACRRGHRRVGPQLTCQERSVNFLTLIQRKYANDDLTSEREQELVDIFLTCCAGVEGAVNAGRARAGAVALDDPNLISDKPEDIAVRSDFKETWIFMEVEIGANGFIKKEFTTPSSITEWSVSAVGLSDRFAMCIAEPLEILVRKDLFIQLDMPYSVIRKEQVEIIATIFNYGDALLVARVYLHTTEKICTEGNPNEQSAEKTIYIEGNSAVSIKYVVIGLEVGEHPILVSVISPSPTDAVRKMLRVLPEGIERSFFSSTTLDPTGTMREELGRQPEARARLTDVVATEVRHEDEGMQFNYFDIRLPRSAVPDSEKCEVSVIGNVLGPVLTAVIEGLDSLLALPRGCGEQTMIYMAPNVYVLRYLTRLDQSTEALEAKATHNIEQGIIKEQVHRRQDGSFSVWGSNNNYPSSTWLTAFVNKVFCHASEFAFVDKKVTCQAIEWLIENTQRADGAFHEIYRVHHREMTGGVQGEATLTAFVLISIHECQCAALTDRIDVSTNLAVDFLEGELDNLQRPYALAIVAYALALVGSDDRHHANLLLKSMDTYDEENGLRYWTADASSLPGDKPYWYRVRPSAITVETTGYALLAQLAIGDVSYSHPIVKWLSTQQNYGGGFSSTQDTTIALQALSEYAVLNSGGDIDMDCLIAQGDLYREEFHFDGTNALVQQHARPPVNGSLEVRTSGTGTGKLSVKVTYNTISEDLNERHCPFTISINAREALADDDDEEDDKNPHRRPGGDQGRSRVGRLEKRQAREEGKGDLILAVRVTVAYNKNEPTNMAIIDVGIYSGFEPIKSDLEQIVTDNAYISRYEISQRSVIFYADFIPPISQEPSLEFLFNVRRTYIVGQIKPVAIKVYDYYNPTEECVKFYHPSSVDVTDSLLDYICEGSVCLCAEGDCAVPASKPEQELLDLTCASAATYAYQITITGSTNENGFKVYTALLIDVLKRGNDDVGGDEVRQFWASSSCTTLRIQNHKSYLVIGQTILPYADTNGNNSFKYIIDATVTIESWPTKSRRRTRDQYNKMESFRRNMLNNNNNCQ